MTAALGLHALRRLELGGGSVVTQTAVAARLVIPSKPSGYADAQLDDTASLARSHFRWRPPLHLRLRARASHPAPVGTLGFGFWNDPFTLSFGQGGAARRVPAAPQTLWFFYASPPADLRFTPGCAGSGWKAMRLASRRLPALALLALAPPAIVLAQIPLLRRPILQAALANVDGCEAVLPADLAAWHTYEIDWQVAEATFWLDGQVVLRATPPRQDRLGFVAWIDNQYATATPEAGFRFGILPTGEAQWLEIADFALVRG